MTDVKNELVESNNFALSTLIRTLALSASYSKMQDVDFVSVDALDEQQTRLDNALTVLQSEIGTTFQVSVSGDIRRRTAESGLSSSADTEIVRQRSLSTEILNKTRQDLLIVTTINTRKIGLRKLVYIYTGSDDTYDSVYDLNDIIIPIVEGDVKLLISQSEQ